MQQHYFRIQVKLQILLHQKPCVLLKALWEILTTIYIMFGVWVWFLFFFKILSFLKELGKPSFHYRRRAAHPVCWP